VAHGLTGLTKYMMWFTTTKTMDNPNLYGRSNNYAIFKLDENSPHKFIVSRT